ncbi:DUF2716 domain-containing protein [Streptomyces sp. BE308]|uniref:DUF2716 domain-containing protein n=1 Tax=Streptomyces sp. BE308 TaxID=3002529 RepID=UPI002E76BBD5|nr:DUF2716 domain-containing protein [Streptomyces sp. BE308]MEE1791828.1 DUF2716 domain-containing protein [Streptomyces sp. BE308]
MSGSPSCIGPSGTLLALDRQHTSYRFAPQGVGGPGQLAWPLSPYPDGDYPRCPWPRGHQPSGGSGCG